MSVGIRAARTTPSRPVHPRRRDGSVARFPKLCPLLLMSGLLSASVPAAAHHSITMFDKHRTARVEGAVTRFEWANPHVYIEVAAPGPRDTKITYRIESASINMLMRYGWRYDSMRTGDRITAVFNPLKNGRPGGLLLEVTLANGTRLKG